MLLTYAVRIHNIGRIGVPRLNVEQMIPPGLKLISVSRHGVRGAGQVRWQVNLPPGHAGHLPRCGQGREDAKATPAPRDSRLRKRRRPR